MISILWLCAVAIIVSLIYPFCLWIFPVDRTDLEMEEGEIDGASVILLSYNGSNCLEKKIDFLLSELAFFKKSELIIIDDHSTDGSAELLEKYNNVPDINIIQKAMHKGIADSMNQSVICAKYESLIFCDQRQCLSENILRNITEPLKFKKVGAVSGFLSHLDKKQNDSVIRRYENYIKSHESQTGNLIGVYGPFYAIKKRCYSRIPEHIILDDLYLSLQILKNEQIVLLPDCIIIDDDFIVLYDYQRCRRYLSGLLQLLGERKIIHDLTAGQFIMLIWHKYLRLLVPVFVFITFIDLGVLSKHGLIYTILFLTFCSFILLSFFPAGNKTHYRVKNIIWMNTFYFIALIDVLLKKIFKSTATLEGITDMP